MTDRRNRGAAVVLAMLLAAFAAAVAATVFADQQRWSRAVAHRRDQVQAQALAVAGVQWSRQILHDDVLELRVELDAPISVGLAQRLAENGVNFRIAVAGEVEAIAAGSITREHD
jgi:type II secretory pathway component PulK